MNDLASNITIGIVSGLFTTLVVVVFHRLWISVIEPWYEERIYKDAKIEGRWKSETDYSGIKLTELYVLQRKSHSITGTATVLEGPVPWQGKTFTIEGVFKNMILTASYTSTDPSTFDRGTLTLMLENNGQTLCGQLIFYFDPEHRVKATTVEWQKQS